MRGCVTNPRVGPLRPPSRQDGCAPPGLPLTLLAAWARPGCGWEGRRWRGAARIRAGWGRVRPSEEGLNICDYRYQGHMKVAFLKQWVTHNLTAVYVNLSFKFTILKQLAPRSLRLSPKWATLNLRLKLTFF